MDRITIKYFDTDARTSRFGYIEFDTLTVRPKALDCLLLFKCIFTSNFLCVVKTLLLDRDRVQT